MDVFNLRNNVIEDYGTYVRSFLTIKDADVRRLVQEEMDGGFLWPDPLIQLNPSFQEGETLKELIEGGELHPECINIFRDKRENGTVGAPFRLHRHQVQILEIYDAMQKAIETGEPYQHPPDLAEVAEPAPPYGDPQASGVTPADRILTWLRDHPGWHARGDIPAAAGDLSAGEWNSAIRKLVEFGEAEKKGEKRGTRYRAALERSESGE